MSKLQATIKGVCAVDPAAPAIECAGVWWKWTDIASVMEELEARLRDAGLGTGVRVGAMMRNEPACAAALASIVSSGRCVVTLNPAMPDDKLAAEFEALKLAVVVGGRREWARPALRGAAAAAGVLGIELPDVPGGGVRLVDGLDMVRATDVRAAPGIAIEMLTSGTTGAPKRIPLKAATLEKMLFDAAIYEKDRQADDGPKLRKGVTFVMVPFAHIGGVWSILNSFVSGRQAFLMERFALEPFLDAMRRHRPRALSTPPTVLKMVLDNGTAKADLQSLAVWRTSTAPLDPDVADQFFDTYGIPVLQVYGATEFAGGVAGWTLDDFKPFGKSKRGSVGRINPGIEARILDPDTRQVLAPGREGVLSLRAEHLGNGVDWIDTTDRAVLDEDNFLWIKGRYDNAIIRGGFKILPDDIVKVIEQHPAVREAAVVGIPDARLGEIPVAAYIVRSGAAPLSEDDLRAFLRAHLSPYQTPARLLAVADLPRTPSMKVSAVGLRELFAEEKNA